MPTPQHIARTIAAECTGLRLRSAARAMTRAYDLELRGAGIRLSQLTILVGVAAFGEGGAAIRELADAIGMDRTTLTRNLQPLMSQGFLNSKISTTDRRSRVVELTTAGAATLEAAFPLWKRAQATTRTELGVSHVASLKTELDRIIDRVRADGASDDGED